MTGLKVSKAGCIIAVEWLLVLIAKGMSIIDDMMRSCIKIHNIFFEAVLPVFWKGTELFYVVRFFVLELVHYVHLILLCRHSFTDDHYVEFSKHSQDRVIGTKGDIAHVSITRGFSVIIMVVALYSCLRASSIPYKKSFETSCNG